MFVLLAIVDPILKSLFHFLGVIMDRGKHDQGTFCDFPTGWDQERVMMVVVQWKRASLKTQVHVSVSAGFYIIPRSDQILGAVSEF